jgi:hypothetical protein
MNLLLPCCEHVNVVNVDSHLADLDSKHTYRE